ncbi:hypothetical protein WQ57_22785 [Mesobacillus campisalis]|uniref:Abortive phage infection protein n=1 Tax=Mesobacillus campisalis TaxID=1408103 RepID=A0A0M2SNE8_9BACI|nr:hypothetical protein [Mesobacillus campisalis]KKK34382.1 hypothetical protein WQ57_22785 [Mesobacillus campisalis]
MTREEISMIFDSLKNGEIEEFLVAKQEFLRFREVLVQRRDFKHFRGIAQRGGDVLYTYTESPRS